MLARSLRRGVRSCSAGPCAAVGVVALVLGGADRRRRCSSRPNWPRSPRPPAAGRSQHHAGARAVPGAATAPGSAYRHYPGAAGAAAAGRDRGPRLVRLQRRRHPRAVQGAGGARRRDLRARYPRPRRLRHPRRHRLSSASSRTISPISSPWCARPARRAADAGRPFLRRRLCAAGGRLADPEPVRAHRAARALSRLRRADHPAERRRLGPRRYSAHRRPARRCARSASPAASRCR